MSDIRLQLTVRRHALPDVKLLWPCTASDDSTIAKLLTDVNDVVPLEAEEWDLEDYSVEVNGFECLHFYPMIALGHASSNVSDLPYAFYTDVHSMLTAVTSSEDGGQTRPRKNKCLSSSKPHTSPAL